MSSTTTPTPGQLLSESSKALLNAVLKLPKSDRIEILDVLLESFAISRSQLGRREPVVGPDQQVINLPLLPIGRHDMRDFSQTGRLIAAGREAGRAMIAEARKPTPRRQLTAVPEPADEVQEA